MVPALPETSRRALLAGMGTGIATVLAGCSASETHQSPPPDDGTLVTDHVTVTTRSSDGRPPVVAPRENNNGDTGDADGSPTTSEPLSIHTIESESEAAEIEFAEDATNVTAVRQLLEETAYASESVLLYQTHIGECYRLKLNYVTRDDDPDVQFCRVVRDAEVDCERSARDHVAAFVRLPFPGDEYGGFSIGSGGSCGPTPERDPNGSESA